MEIKNTTPAKENKKQGKNIWLVALVVVIVIVLGWFIYRTIATQHQAGTTVQKNDNFVVRLPEINSGGFAVAVDKNVYSLPPETKTYSDRLSAQDHNIIVSAPNYWPWSKDISSDASTRITLRPFLVKRDFDTKEYAQGTDTMYATAEKLFDEQKGRTSILSESGLVRLSINGKKLSASVTAGTSSPSYFCNTLGVPLESANNNSGNTHQGSQCPEERQVIDIQAGEILGADFYRERDDVAIFAVPVGVFAIDIGGGTPQNIQPIYEGSVSSVAFTQNTLYVKPSDDPDTIIAIPLT